MADLLIRALPAVSGRPGARYADHTARAYLDQQAATLRALGSPFAGAVLSAAARALDGAPVCRALIADWPGDRSAAALGMRLNAALHFVAREDPTSPLAAVFRDGTGDFDVAIGAAMTTHDRAIAARMAHPTQTNEVARTGAFMAALMVLAGRFGLPFELLELGASAGLNLNLRHYAHQLGGVAAGSPSARVVIAPTWLGADPPAHPVDIICARGVDLDPIDVASQDAGERLQAYVFADQTARRERLSEALLIARRQPPMVERGLAGRWLPERLAEPQAAGRCRVVLHSMLMQYLSLEERYAIDGAMREAGENATSNRPLAIVGLEWTTDRSEVRLTLTCWPDGRQRTLAICHPYGEWIDWRHAGGASAR